MTKLFFFRYILPIILIAALAAWVYSRWDAWFHNPPEEPYEVPTEPSRVMLTFGNEGEMSRYVTWMCDTLVDQKAKLLLVTPEADTLEVEAQGEVFVSRAGQAAYYRALLTQLQPESTYDYAVESGGHRSPWFRFRTSDPGADHFSFLYMGDVQDTLGGIANQLLRQAVARHAQVEFVAFGGDLTERPTDAYWGETFRSIDSVCTTLPVLNITGNHDYLKYLIRKCERRFVLHFPYFMQGMEERDDENHLFHLRYHNADFYLLDSDRGLGFLWGQRRWLAKQLDITTAQHRIVMLHHPLYSVKRKHNNLVARWMFNDLIREAQVELVLQGHEHAYTHCTASDEPLTAHECLNPPLYTVSHCSPKNYNIHPTARFAPVLSGSRYYQVVTVDAQTVTMCGYDAMTGEQVDSVRILR